MIKSHQKYLRWMVLALGIIMSQNAAAQQKPDTVANISGIQIETSVDRAEMYIGDLIKYTITVTYDGTVELLPPPLGANLGAFDVKDYQTDITSKLPDGRVKSENRFVLSTFTTGNYIIPTVPMTFQFPDGTRKVVLSESVPIKVNSLLLDTNDSADIHPLKAPYEFKRNYTKYYIWGSVAFVVLAALSFYLWRKLRAKKEAAPLDLRPAWEIAFEKLAKLEQKGFLTEERFKEFYIELTEILRLYLGRMFAANITDMTTDEFFGNYESIGLPNDARDSLEEFFDQADIVKFAKFIPTQERSQADFKYVHDLIERVRKDFQLKAEQEARINPPSRPALVSQTNQVGSA